MGGPERVRPMAVRGLKLALSKSQMQMIIRKNGHLMMDGSESADDLRTTLMYLAVCHGAADCHRPNLGISIDILLPNTGALVVKSTKRPNATRKTVDIKTERL